jgi:tetratricopeptide (TPR) repeat protein
VGEAQKLAQRAVDLDPHYVAAWQFLAFTYFDQADLGWAQDRIAALGRARQLNDKVLQLDPESASPYWLRASLELQPDLPEYDPDAALAVPGNRWNWGRTTTPATGRWDLSSFCSDISTRR